MQNGPSYLSPPRPSRHQDTRPAAQFPTPQEINYQHLSHSNLRDSSNESSFGILRQSQMDHSFETRVRNNPAHLNSTVLDPSHHSDISQQPDISPIRSPTNHVTTASTVLQYSPPLPGNPSVPQPPSLSSPTLMITTAAPSSTATNPNQAIRIPVVTTDVLSSIASILQPPFNNNLLPNLLMPATTAINPLAYPSTAHIIQNVTTTPQVTMSLQNKVSKSQVIYDLSRPLLPPTSNVIYNRSRPPTTAEENGSQHPATIPSAVSAIQVAKDFVKNIRSNLSAHSSKSGSPRSRSQ